jgi:hypothetical protein
VFFVPTRFMRILTAINKIFSHPQRRHHGQPPQISKKGTWRLVMQQRIGKPCLKVFEFLLLAPLAPASLRGNGAGRT